MRNTERLRDTAGIVDVLTGATGPLAVRRRAVVVELQRDADDVIALTLEEAGHNRGIDAARHRHHDARVFRTSLKAERIDHITYPNARPRGVFLTGG